MLAMLDLSKMCRVCRDESDCLLDLFVDSCLPNKEPNLAVMLSKCSGCPVDRADGYPQFICTDCAGNTRRAFRLRRQFRRSMQYFNQLRGMMVELDGIDDYLNLENKVKLEDDKAGGLGPGQEVSYAVKKTEEEADGTMLECLFVELVAPTQCKAPESPENVKTKRRDSDVNRPLTQACNKKSSESISGDLSPVERKTRAVKRLRYHSGSSSDDSWTPSMHKKAKDKKGKCFKCPQCDASFDQKNSLQLHLRVHTGIRPYQCSHCPRSFTQKGNLQTHFRIHTGERPFKCSFCPLTFRQLCHLLVHKRIHTGEKPFKCSQCSYAFKQKVNLQKHMMTAHTGTMQKPRKRSGLNNTT